MVVIELAPSTGASIGGLLAGGLSIAGHGKRLKAEQDAREKSLQMAQQKLDLLEAKADTERETRQRIMGERKARMAQQDLELRGVGTPADINHGATMEAAQGFMQHGPMKGVATAGAAEMRRQENMRAFESVFADLDPEMRDHVIQQSKQAQAEQQLELYARGLLKKVRMMDRAEDVLPGTEDALGAMEDHLDRLIQSGQAGTREGLQSVLQAEKALNDLREEQRNDKLRRQNADDFEMRVLALAGEHPGLKRLAHELAEMNRDGTIESPDVAMGKFLAEWSPGAFVAGQKATAQKEADEKLQALYVQGLKELTRTDPSGRLIMPKRPELDEWVALAQLDVGKKPGAAYRGEQTAESGPTKNPLAMVEAASQPAQQQQPAQAPQEAAPAPRPAPVNYLDLSEPQRAAIDQAIAKGATPQELGLTIEQVPMPTLERWAAMRKQGKANEKPEGTDFGPGLDFIHDGSDPRLSGKVPTKLEKRNRTGPGGRRGDRARGKK